MRTLLVLWLLLPGLAWAQGERSQRVAGTWHTTTGIHISLQPGKGGGLEVVEAPKHYTATWTSDTTFTYTADGTLVTATYDRRNDSIKLTAGGKWYGTWRRDKGK